MKKKIICLVVLVIFLMGCTSVPVVGRYYSLEEGIYRVSIDRDYTGTEEELRYAVNSFVISRGGNSYDIEEEGRSNNFIITIPGNTMVIENMPEVRHFHKGRTIGTILGIAIPTNLLLFMIIITAVAESSTR
jgi:hypothetical protein